MEITTEWSGIRQTIIDALKGVKITESDISIAREKRLTVNGVELVFRKYDSGYTVSTEHEDEPGRSLFLGIGPTLEAALTDAVKYSSMRTRLGL
jgi:hypothetical protein